MHLRCGQFQWPWRCAGAIQSAAPNAARPGLSRKPPDVAIGQLLALYCPCGCQGINQHKDNAACTHFAARFDDHRDVTVLYRTHHPMEEGCGFHKATKHRHQTSDEHLLRYYKRDIAMPRIHYLLRVSGAGDGAIELDG
jgi:hypothetical protein